MSEFFEKGTRVRVAEGDHVGVVGEIFWWGRSKFGSELRAGILSDADGERVWVVATEVVAIDEDGNDLANQPEFGGSKPPREFQVRHVELPSSAARAITTRRLDLGYPPSKAAETTVRMDHLRRVEDALGCTIPDLVLAYVTSGVGETPSKEVDTVLRLTDELLAALGRDDAAATADHIAFDKQGGTYLVFARGATQDSVAFQRLEHEPGISETSSRDLGEQLVGRVDKIDPRVAPFEVAIDYLARDEAPDPADAFEIWVTHAKFGRGRVIESEPSAKGDKLTIEFDDTTRKLLDRFVQYES